MEIDITPKNRRVTKCNLVDRCDHVSSEKMGKIAEVFGNAVDVQRLEDQLKVMTARNDANLKGRETADETSQVLAQKLCALEQEHERVKKLTADQYNEVHGWYTSIQQVNTELRKQLNKMRFERDELRASRAREKKARYMYMYGGSCGGHAQDTAAYQQGPDGGTGKAGQRYTVGAAIADGMSLNEAIVQADLNDMLYSDKAAGAEARKRNVMRARFIKLMSGLRNQVSSFDLDLRYKDFEKALIEVVDHRVKKLTSQSK